MAFEKVGYWPDYESLDDVPMRLVRRISVCRYDSDSTGVSFGSATVLFDWPGLAPGEARPKETGEGWMTEWEAVNQLQFFGLGDVQPEYMVDLVRRKGWGGEITVRRVVESETSETIPALS